MIIPLIQAGGGGRSGEVIATNHASHSQCLDMHTGKCVDLDSKPSNLVYMCGGTLCYGNTDMYSRYN